MSILKAVREIGLASILAISTATCTTSSTDEYHHLESSLFTKLINTYSNTHTATQQTFKREVLDAKLPVLVDFHHPRCGYCKMAKPHVERLAKEYVGKVKTVYYDCSKDREIPLRYQIRGYPTFVLFKNGKPWARINGWSQKALENVMKKATK